MSGNTAVITVNNSTQPGLTTAVGSGSAGATASATFCVYPRNGQTEQQTSTDRYECHSWAVNQTGFDPTQSNSSGNPADYRRAMIACLEARGYSAK